LKIVFGRARRIGVTFEQDIGVLVLVENYRELRKLFLACGSQRRFVYVEQKTGVKRDLYALADSFDLGTGKILLHFSGLFVHVLTYERSGSATNRGSQYGANGRVAGFVADQAPKNTPGCSAYGRALLLTGPSRATDRRQNQQAAQGQNNKFFHVYLLLSGLVVERRQSTTEKRVLTTAVLDCKNS
jgi:hypothetical protein